MSSAPNDQPAAVRGSGQEAVTNAAREIFSQRGYHGTSIRDIAKLAGLSLSALYYWYPSKEHLLAAIIEGADTDYHARCENALAGTGPSPVDRLAALVRVTVEFRVERRTDSAITTREYRNLDAKRHDYIARQSELATQRWAGVIDAGVASGAFRCEYPDDARRTIIAACNAIAQWYHVGGEITLEDLVTRYTDIAFRVVDLQVTGGAAS